MPETHWYFKLFNSIKEKHEIDFAELELNSLFGKVERVRNFSDVLQTGFFGEFRNGAARLQDILAHELPYGECHGFSARTEQAFCVSHLVRRLAYTREFFVVCRSDDHGNILQQMFPEGEVGKNVEAFQKNGCVLLRFITNQYFLEKSQYISKLSRNEQEASRNVDILFSFLTKNLHRIPATETMQIGKRLEDYFAIREEPSLYLTHYMHPYKGKFHPKMARSLLNYVSPRDTGTVMDNFAGCGTLLVEATWMGLDSVGMEINPLSALMCNVKCDSLLIPLRELQEESDNFLQKLRSILSYYEQSSCSSQLSAPKYDKGYINKRKKNIPDAVLSLFSNSKTVDYILLAHELAKTVRNKRIRDFLMLVISGTISDLTRRQHGEFFEALQRRLRDLCLRIFVFDKLNSVMKIKLGASKTYAGDTRNMKMIESGSMDAIVNSPPYSTALDYIKNDFPQLTLLDLADVTQLEKDMIGNPRLKVYPQSLLREIKDNSSGYGQLPDNAREAVSVLVRFGRTKEALRAYKFFKDMFFSLKEMHRVMKPCSKCVIIIGNNHYKLDDNYIEVKNDEVLKKMAFTIGFKEDRTIKRGLEKTRTGMIRYESILILEKH